VTCKLLFHQSPGGFRVLLAARSRTGRHPPNGSPTSSASTGSKRKAASPGASHADSVTDSLQHSLAQVFRLKQQLPNVHRLPLLSSLLTRQTSFCLSRQARHPPSQGSVVHAGCSSFPGSSGYRMYTGKIDATDPPVTQQCMHCGWIRQLSQFFMHRVPRERPSRFWTRTPAAGAHPDLPP
jgi:hypothetical protein